MLVLMFSNVDVNVDVKKLFVCICSVVSLPLKVLQGRKQGISVVLAVLFGGIFEFYFCPWVWTESGLCPYPWTKKSFWICSKLVPVRN